MRRVILIGIVIAHISAYSQGVFAPPAGQVGSTAIHKDSAAIQSWGTTCSTVIGPVDIADPSLGIASVGSADDAIGMADGSVVSLGDHGTATVSFDGIIYDGPGYDFAVFENSFSDSFLELGFVEVSSDGSNFFRFPSTCNLQDSLQIGPFGASDASHINNLAGKYRAQYGTPFDLQDLSGISGLNLDEITHVRIVDCIGSIQAEFATYDQHGQIINDPYPTPFPSGGFDLDAVGVIHFHAASAIEELAPEVSLFPNPVVNRLTIGVDHFVEAIIYNIQGQVVLVSTSNTMDCSELPSGHYRIGIRAKHTSSHSSFIKQ